MNKLTPILCGIIVALSAICVVQNRTVSRLQEQVRQAKAQLEQTSAELAEAETARKSAEERKLELAQARDQLLEEARSQRSSAGGAVSAGSTQKAAPASASETNSQAGALGGMLSKMMSDPDTKNFIRSQQRAMVDQLYRPLIKQLGLTAEEATAFKELLADNMIRSAEKATSLMGNLSATNRAELASSLAAEQNSADEQVRALLGESRYHIYKDYQETAGERTQLSMFQQQAEAGEHRLNDQQVEQLLAFMREEKKIVAADFGLDAAAREQAGLEAVLSEDQGTRMLDSQAAVNQRVYERARGVLTPEQLQSFAAFQTNQLQMMRMGLSMARRMMAPEPGGNPASR